MESSWVRSVYLYVMCAVAVLLMAGGAVMSVVSVTNLISPSLGHRDSMDRVGVGLANVATDVVQIVSGQSDSDLQEIRDYCEEWAGDEVDSCIEEMSGSGQTQALQDGIAAVKGEIESQIRDTALAKLIRGLLLLVVGWLLWRYHAHRTELYRDGLQARPKPVAPVAAAPSVVTEATMPISTLPPPAAE